MTISPTSLKTIHRRLTEIRDAAEKTGFTPEMRERLTQYLDFADLSLERWPLREIEFDTIADALTANWLPTVHPDQPLDVAIGMAQGRPVVPVEDDADVGGRVLQPFEEPVERADAAHASAGVHPADVPRTLDHQDVGRACQREQVERALVLADRRVERRPEGEPQVGHLQLGLAAAVLRVRHRLEPGHVLAVLGLLHGEVLHG